MESFTSYLDRIPVESLLRITAVVMPLIFVLVLGNLVLSLVERTAGAQSSKRRSAVHVRQAIRIFRYIFIALVILVGAFSYSGSWTGLGVSLGVMAAAAGFALQRPAASVAAWFTILVKRPFGIGDRIVIGTIARGDVLDVTLTHISLAEVGRYGAEDVSGRTILVPNNVIFELPVTRYGDGEDTVLGEVELTVTYDSNVKRAREIAEEVASSVSGADSRAHTRVKLTDNGVLMEIRYDVKVRAANRVASEISEGILDAIRQEEDIQLAYARMDVRMVQK